MPSPSPTHPSYLFSISALSPTDAWAVGFHSPAATPATLVEHWDGASWSVVPSPSPGSASSLLSVSAVSADDVWAVGGYDKDAITPSTLIEHWDGHHWTIVPSPSPGSYASGLSAVAGATRHLAYAVGSFQNGGHQYPLVELWDGHGWGVVPTPTRKSVISSSFFGVGILGARAWAVGQEQKLSSVAPLAEHWNGLLWTRVPTDLVLHANVLRAVVPLSDTDAWAVGSRGAPGRGPRRVRDPRGALGRPPVDGGQGRESRRLGGAVRAHRRLPLGPVGRGHLQPGPQGHPLPLIERWDGASWTAVPSPHIETSGAGLLGVATVPGTHDLWAVGFRGTPQGGDTLIERACGL